MSEGQFEEATPRATMSALEARLRTHPGDDEARWKLVDAYEHADRDTHARQVLERGVEVGDDKKRFAAALLLRDPFAGDDAMLAMLRDVPGYVPTLVVALAAHDRNGEALALARETIDTDAAQGALARDRWIETTLRAFASGDVELGRAVLDQTERQLPSHADTERDDLTRELSDGADEIDDGLFVALANTVLDDDDAPLEAFRRDHAMSARAKLDALRKVSRPLAKRASAVLMREAPQPALPMKSAGPWFGVAVAFFILRLLLRMSACANEPTYDTRPVSLPSIGDSTGH